MTPTTNVSSSNNRQFWAMLMLAQLLTSTHAWGLASSSTFLGSNAPSLSSSAATSSSRRHASFVSMDIETPASTPREQALLKRFQISLQQQNLRLDVPRIPTDTNNLQRQQQHVEIDATAALYGMPWKTSMDQSYDRDQLFYMPFWTWQMQFMKENLTNLRVLPCTSRDGLQDLSYAENTQKQQRLHTLVLQSDEYKYIRLTVLDAGSRTQVFTSVWYPDPAHGHLPVLGCDLLQFGETRHLGICDFQPITTKEQQQQQGPAAYEQRLEQIRNQYPSLQGEMTQRFYHPDASFFSKQMLLGRANVASAKSQPKDNNKKSAPSSNEVSSLDEAHAMMYQDLFPAYQQYVQTHVNMVQSKRPVRQQVRKNVLERHIAYDTYSAENDPAHGLLAASFGRDFANAYVYDVLFPLAERPAAAAAQQDDEP